MQKRRTTAGRNKAATGAEDVTRDSMLREDDTMTDAEATTARERAYDKDVDNDYWSSEGPGPRVMADDGRSDLGARGTRVLRRAALLVLNQPSPNVGRRRARKSRSRAPGTRPLRTRHTTRVGN